MFGDFKERLRRQFAVRKLQKQLNYLLRKFDTLNSFNVPAGDHRYVELSNEVGYVVNDLTSNYGFSRNDVYTTYPKLDQVDQYIHATTDNLEAQVRVWAPRAIVGVLVTVFVWTFIHALASDEYYLLTHWLMKS